jgi:hypothetical protein
MFLQERFDYDAKSAPPLTCACDTGAGSEEILLKKFQLIL